eukprot:6205607-Pleurochrysis_carterae.AAC.3
MAASVMLASCQPEMLLRRSLQDHCCVEHVQLPFIEETTGMSRPPSAAAAPDSRWPNANSLFEQQQLSRDAVRPQLMRSR